VSIDFQKQIEIKSRSRDETGLYCAVGSIDYSRVDGQHVSPGTLIYLKPTLRGAGDQIPYDVVSYSNMGADFPHESTADQWFDESQFESYRALGRHAISQITNRTDQALSLTGLEAAVRNYMDSAGAAAPPVAAARPVPAPAGGIA
jgi:hypothetical protein